MTTEQFIQRQREKLARLKSGEAVAIAAQDTHVQMVERIFETGKQADGKKKKYNSKDPIYVNPKNAPKSFKPKGKSGDTIFSNGDEHKTGYFDSYKDYRAAMGRETKHVNLNLFGILQSDFSKGVVKLDDLKYVSTVTQESNKGTVEKFGEYFKLNKDERKNFKEVLEYETLEILK
jgi:hypothetical protein